MPRVEQLLLHQSLHQPNTSRHLEDWIESVSATTASVTQVDVTMPDMTQHVIFTKPKLDVNVKETVEDAGDSNYSDDFETEEVIIRVEKEPKTLRVYRKACKRFKLVPIRKVMRQFGSLHMSFKDFDLTRKELKALCMALLYERDLWHLDLSGNTIGRRELDYVISVLGKVSSINVLDMSNNLVSRSSLTLLADFLRKCDTITEVDLSGNKLTDKDGQAIADILEANTTLTRLGLSHNELRESGGKVIGAALARNSTLEELDLSWNHLRQKGAISIAKGLETNRCLRTVNLAWNGFGFEGSVALGDMLLKNSTITSLDVSSNRISPPALLEVIRGLTKNRALTTLQIGHNPITASFTSVLLDSVLKHPQMALQRLTLEGVVVDKEFEGLVEKIRETRYLEVTYDVSLPISKKTPEEMMKELQYPAAYNIDPLRMLYLLKEKNRARDFFQKINKDKDDGLTRDELFLLFKEAGIPCTSSVVDRIMQFMDTNGDGSIDLAEFLAGDKKIKKYSREQIRNSVANNEENYAKYSRTFRKATIDPLTLSLKVEDSSKQFSSNNLMPPLTDSRRGSTSGFPGSRRGSNVGLPGSRRGSYVELPGSRRGSNAELPGSRRGSNYDLPGSRRGSNVSVKQDK